MTRDEMKQAAWVMVLNGDDTWTGLDGCWFALTTSAEVEALDEDDMEINDLPPETIRYSMVQLLEWAIDHGYFDAPRVEETGE
jgi:hypothetical protein